MSMTRRTLFGTLAGVAATVMSGGKKPPSTPSVATSAPEPNPSRGWTVTTTTLDSEQFEFTIDGKTVRGVVFVGQNNGG